MVDLIKPDSGKIEVFAEKPGKRVCIPGRNLGFMFQEISLLDYFSIREMAYYFGKINEMFLDQSELTFHFISFYKNLLSFRTLFSHSLKR